MASNIDRIIEKMKPSRVVKVPNCGGGAFGAARISHIMSDLLSQSSQAPPSVTTPESVALSVSVTAASVAKFSELADRATHTGHPITKSELAAQLLEDAIQRHERDQPATV